ncbi:hypothetical protein UQW22_00385 [Isoptericola halotolerans]|uniref:hypothetical protein n=1 Tax=Isoptericola halotolerans TaxID=300560 RepID=UPI00388EFF40
MNNDHSERPDAPETAGQTTADSPAVPPTQQLPSGEVPTTAALPTSPGPQAAGSTGRSTDPLAVFDEPVRSAGSAPEPTTASRPEPSASGTAAPAAPLVRSGPRTTTIVWGLIVVAIGIGLLATTAGATIDLELAAILLLGVAGLLLVVGSVAGSMRRRRRASAG